MYDAIVIGAGPAGLTAAVYLGRFRRRSLVLEDGQSRARWIPSSHNIPGFAAGISGEKLLKTLREQAHTYGADIKRGHVSKLSQTGDRFIVHTDEATYESRYVVIATGVRDHLPDISGLTEAVLRSVLRFCPICDAFEAIDQRIAVLGDGALGEREAKFLRSYSRQVTLLQLESTLPQTTEPLKGSGIEQLTVQLTDIMLSDSKIQVKAQSEVQEFDVMYLALGCSPQHDLALSLSAACDEKGALTVNAHQETSICGLYAAGDLVRGLNQVVVAAAEAAIVATDIHNKLRANESIRV